MSSDDPKLSNDRVGRWIPRYSGPAHRGFGRFRRGGAEFEIVGTLAVLGLLAILALVGVIVADLPRPESRTASPRGAALPVPPEFSAPSFLPPLLSAPPPRSPRSSPPPVPPGSAVGTPRTSAPTRTTPTKKAPAPATARLVVGTAVSLEPVRQPGTRVRHRNFRARVDRIGADSEPGDRADATFRVRSALAGGSRCVSLEATNFPHYFLRHQHFAVFLQPDDGSALFAADATFCPVPVAGGALILRSVNFPNRYVTERDSRLFLDVVSPGAALALSVRSPLIAAAGFEQLVSGPAAARVDRVASRGSQRCDARSVRAHRLRCNCAMTCPAGSARTRRSPAG